MSSDKHIRGVNVECMWVYLLSTDRIIYSIRANQLYVISFARFSVVRVHRFRHVIPLVAKFGVLSALEKSPKQ